ncbi:hypothetical protein Trydic_g23796 [Trypoxylus dichotomus]
MYKFHVPIVVRIVRFLSFLLSADLEGTVTVLGSQYYLYEVDIEDCTSLPCPLTIGHQYRINMAIYANSESEILRQEVYLILKSVYKKIDVTPDDPCNQIRCPVTNNLGVSFSALVTIDETLVPLEGELLWRLFNEDDAMVLCMRTDVVLQTG